MKIVDDKFQYNDPNNKNLGYKISVGKQQKKSIVLDFTTGRGKNKKKSLIKEVSSKVHSESFHNCGVVWLWGKFLLYSPCFFFRN